ncbi:MAG: hypothetical protein KDD40_03345 [Bdellovibrionales bacterium]|nr:hypothetical protein [Bdellovibrionales bacterium]
MISCAQGHCRRLEQRTNSTSEQDASQLPTNTRQLKVYKRRVLVYKYDESKQCQAWQGISLEQMENELKEVKV